MKFFVILTWKEINNLKINSERIRKEFYMDSKLFSRIFVTIRRGFPLTIQRCEAFVLNQVFWSEFLWNQKPQKFLISTLSQLMKNIFPIVSKKIQKILYFSVKTSFKAEAIYRSHCHCTVECIILVVYLCGKISLLFESM